MTEPVSLDEIKEHLRLDADETGEDDYLTSLMLAARRVCEKATNLSIVGETATMKLAAFPGEANGFILPLEVRNPKAREIVLGGGAVASATVSYYDQDGASQTLDPSEYYAALDTEPALLSPVTAWPSTSARPDAVTVTFVVSPLATDDREVACQAIRLIVGSWYKFREANAVDVRGAPAEIPLSATWLLNFIKKWPTT